MRIIQSQRFEIPLPIPLERTCHINVHLVNIFVRDEPNYLQNDRLIHENIIQTHEPLNANLSNNENKHPTNLSRGKSSSYLIFFL
jgi:hypothetical protein